MSGTARYPLLSTVTRRIQTHISFNNVSWIRTSIYTHGVLSLISLALALGLSATETTNTIPVVAYTIFTTLFAILGWLYITSFAPRFKDRVRVPTTLAVGLLSFGFYLGAPLWMTIALSPWNNCSDLEAIQSNYVIQGDPLRCRLAQVESVFLWFGMSFLLDIAY
jgi:hypothetical protein